MYTIETYIVVYNSGARFFFDNEDAACTFARCSTVTKGVYKAILEVKAHEEIDYALPVEPDWEAISKEVERDTEAKGQSRDSDGESEVKGCTVGNS